MNVRLVGLLVLGFTPFLGSRAATATATPQAACVIIGTVLSAQDNRPLGGARLSLDPLDGMDMVQRFTDRTGSFCFERVKPGTYLLKVERSGYIGQYYGAGDARRGGTPLELAEGQAGLEINFRLNASGTVQGRVTDMEGQPLPDIRVVAHERVAPGRIIRREGAKFSLTDHEGTYRIDGLRPGKYVLETDYDMADRPLRLSNSSEIGVGTVTYYPNVTTLGEAVPAELSPGSTRNADIILQAVPAYAVRGRLVGSPPVGKQVCSVQMIPQRDGPRLPALQTDPTQDGRFEFPRVRPGEYRAGAMIGNRKEGCTMNYNNLAYVTVANSDVGGVLVTLAVGSVVSGHVFLQGMTELPAGAVVWLRNEKDLEASGWQAPIEKDGTFQFQSVPAGIYSIWPHPGSPYFVESARLAGNEVHDRLRVPEGEAIAGLEVVFSAVGGTITGKVLNSLDAAAQSPLILLIPEGTKAITVSNFFYRFNSEGGFVLRGIRPGVYTVLALEDPEEWGDIQGADWDDLVKRGTPVRVRAGTHLTLNLKSLRPPWISN